MNTKKQLAYEKIKELIVHNELDKDSPLVERQLCDIIGISRTPIREALRELANEDYVEIIEGKGIYIKKIDFRDMMELFELREALEGMSIRLFTERAEEAYLLRLRDYMTEQQQAYDQGNHRIFMDIDMKIHSLIADGSKNRRLRDEIIMIYDHIRQIAILAQDDTQVRDTAMKAHIRIFEAVLEGDPERSQEAMVQHIRETLELHEGKYYLL